MSTAVMPEAFGTVPIIPAELSKVASGSFWPVQGENILHDDRGVALRSPGGRRHATRGDVYEDSKAKKWRKASRTTTGLGRALGRAPTFQPELSE